MLVAVKQIVPPIFFKELGLQSSYFWGETIHFFWQFQKQSIYFQQEGKQLFILSKMGNNLFISIFSSTHPLRPDIKWSAP